MSGEMVVEFGVLYVEQGGETFIRGGFNEAGARALIKIGHDFDPCPTRVMRREPGNWEAVDDGVGEGAA